MSRTRKPAPALDMFADGSDLPLWSGTPIPATDSPFAPVARPVPVADPLPLPGLDEPDPDPDPEPATNAYEERQQRRRERLEAAAERADQESGRRYQAARAISEHIPFGQPILVGHHSEARHRRDLDKIDTNMRKSVEAHDQAAELRRRAAAVGTGGISSDDPEAVAKLRAELDAAKAAHERMVAANKLVRRGDRAGLAALGFSEEQIHGLFNPRFGGRPGFPAYMLSNSSANMRRIEQRIEDLGRRAEAEAAFEPIAGEGWTISAADNRVIVRFDERQSAEMTQRLKSRGFRWTPSREAWTRQFNARAVYDARWCVGAA